jgi:4-hydroxybenzoate polyprenyltransferase
MEKAVKALAIATALVLVASLTLVALGIMSWRLFWVVAIAAAIMAYYVIPKLKGEKKEKELWEK